MGIEGREAEREREREREREKRKKRNVMKRRDYLVDTLTSQHSKRTDYHQDSAGSFSCASFCASAAATATCDSDPTLFATI